MGVQTHVLVDFTTPISPTRLFKAVAINNHDVIPKAVPQFVQSIDIIEGTPTAAGCVKQVNFVPGSPFKYVKNKVDVIDLENLQTRYTTIEGDVLGDKWESIVYEHKLEANGSGTQYKMRAHYHPKGDYVLPEEELARSQEFVKNNTTALTEYLLANPQVCA